MLRKINIIKSLKNPFKDKRIVFVIGTLFGIFLSIVLTPTMAPFIAQFSFFNFIDEDKPEILGIYSPDKKYFGKSPTYLNFYYHDSGGSGIDDEKTYIEIFGEKYGYTYSGEITYYTMEYFVVKISGRLIPDAYKMDIQLYDRGGNYCNFEYSFFVFEETDLSTILIQIEEESSDYLSFLLSINNENKCIIENLFFETEFPGLIETHDVIDKTGTTGLSIDYTINSYITGEGIVNTSSKSAVVYVDKILPNSNIIIIFKVNNTENLSDFDVFPYTLSYWCRQYDTFISGNQTGKVIKQ